MDKKIIVLIAVILLVLGGFIGWVLLRGDNSKKTNTETKTNTSNLENTENKIVEEINNNEEESISENQNNEKVSSNKSVVVYFSATGNTEKVAKKIGEVTDADIIEIIPQEKYTNADLNYSNDNARANKEQNDKNSRPEIANNLKIDEYDTIYLGYPIWWGDVPKIILTLLDNYNFENKTVIPFCTSGSSGISQSINTLKSYNKNVNWIEGKRFSNSVSNSDIKEWITTLNIQSDTNISKGDRKEMYIKINNKILTATLESNSSVDALVEKLKQNDITIDMSDYSNFEKVGNLGFDLPRNDTQISTDYGDLILYQGNSFVIYYDKNNWNFTKLGHIDNISQDELKQILGSGDVIVTLSLEK